MKLHHVPETDSLYVGFQERPSVDTREIAPNVRRDLEAEGRPPWASTIDHASTPARRNCLPPSQAGMAVDGDSRFAWMPGKLPHSGG